MLVFAFFAAAAAAVGRLASGQRGGPGRAGPGKLVEAGGGGALPGAAAGGREGRTR